MEKFSLLGQDRLKRAHRKNNSVTRYSQDSDVRHTLIFAVIKYPTEVCAEDT